MTTPSEPLPTAPLVFVTVGTDHHPFNRVLGWVTRWAAEHDVSERCFFQSGTSEVPDGVRAESFVTHAQAQELFASSHIVITHGGPGTIVEIRRQGSKPIVVPRRSDLGEHVDDHQIKFARQIAKSGMVDLAEGEDQLRELLDALYNAPRRVVEESDDAARIGRMIATFADIVDPLIQQGRSRVHD